MAGHRGVDLFGHGHVGRYRQGPGPGGGQLCDQGRQWTSGGGQVDQAQGQAVAGQAHGNGTPDTAGGAGDERRTWATVVISPHPTSSAVPPCARA